MSKFIELKMKSDHGICKHIVNVDQITLIIPDSEDEKCYIFCRGYEHSIYCDQTYQEIKTLLKNTGNLGSLACLK